jgi:ribosomal protein S26
LPVVLGDAAFRICETCSQEAVLSKAVEKMYTKGKVDAAMFREDVTFKVQHPSPL